MKISEITSLIKSIEDAKMKLHPGIETFFATNSYSTITYWRIGMTKKVDKFDDPYMEIGLQLRIDDRSFSSFKEISFAEVGGGIMAYVEYAKKELLKMVDNVNIKI